MMDDDLIDLLSAWRGCELPQSRCDELMERLERDEAFAQSFVDEIRLLGMLKAVQSTEPRWLALHEALGWGQKPSHRTEGDHEDSIMGRLAETTPRRFGRVSKRAGAAAAAAVLVAALGWLTWSKGGRFVPAWNWSVAAKSGRDLAVVMKLSGVQWESPGGREPAEGELLPAGRFRLRSGQAFLVFLNGVTLTLDGPADIDLVSIDRVFCRQGRLRVRVPKGVEGFVVASPGSAVVDLGTEFAMNVEPGGKSRVMVIEGAAEASLLDPQGFTRHTQRVDENTQFEVDPNAGSIAEAAVRPDQFLSRRDDGVPPLKLDPAYSGAVMASKPLSYWRFESLEGDAVPNEIPGGPPLRRNGPVRVASGPRTNGHAVFSAAAPEQYLTTDSPWKLTRGSRHAIEFWFLSDTIRYSTLVGLYPAVSELPRTLKYHHVMSVETMAYPTLSLEKPASVRFLRRWLREVDLFAEEHNLFSQSIYVPRRWHHVVAQRSGNRMELYLNGARDHATTAENDPPGIFYHLVVGRRTAEPTEVKESRPFVGRLDELVLYDHPLSPEEIQNHFRLAAPHSDAE